MSGPPKAKLDKPRPKPKFSVGQKVTTKYTAKVPKSGPFNRRWLFLLPGTEWTVDAVEVPKSGQPIYTLRAGEFTIERRRWRLKAMR